MRVREMEYKLYKESTTLQTAYITTENYEKSKALQKRQDDIYKKWKFYNRLRKEMEKENDKKLFRNSSSK